MESAMEQLKDFVEILGDDVLECNRKLLKEDGQFWRRAYVRAVFALIEGLTFRMKQISLEAYQIGEINLSAAEVSLLREETYELTDKGEASVQVKFVQLPKNLKFSFKMFARAYDLKFELETGGAGWSAFKDALEVRNRLTHPKHKAHLVVSDIDLNVVRKANLWFAESARTLTDAYVQNLESKIRRA